MTVFQLLDEKYRATMKRMNATTWRNITSQPQHPAQTIYRGLEITAEDIRKNGGWNGEAAAWAAEQSGNVNMPFFVEISVNDKTPCPRWCVVQFLWKVKFMERS